MATDFLVPPETPEEGAVEAEGEHVLECLCRLPGSTGLTIYELEWEEEEAAGLLLLWEWTGNLL